MWKEPSSLRSTRRLWICRDMGVGSGSEGLSRGPSSYITQEHMIHHQRNGESQAVLIKPGSCVSLPYTYLQVNVCISDRDLHREHARGGIIIEEDGKISQRCHEEVSAEGLQPALQEAVVLGQRGASSRFRPALQPDSDLWIQLLTAGLLV